MRVLLSDGARSHPCILASQLGAQVAAGALRAGSLVRLDDCVCNVVKGKR